MRERNEQIWEMLPMCVRYHMSQYKHSKPLAVVIDIDGTIFHESNKLAMENCVLAFRRLQELGCDIFIVTARTDSSEIRTIDQLAENGIYPNMYKAIYFRESNNNQPVLQLKKNIRADIQKNHDIILSVGNRVTDLIQHCESPSPYHNIFLQPS